MEVLRLGEAPTPDLVARLEEGGEPAVVVGGARDWPGAAWTLDGLRRSLGPIVRRFKHSPSHRHPDFHAPLREAFATESLSFDAFFDRITTGDERARWWFTGDEHFVWRRRGDLVQRDEALAPLLEGVRFDGLLPRERLRSIWGWFSGPGVRTWLHYDNNGCHNLNAQLLGRKTCLLIPPHALRATAPFPLGGANPAVNCCAVDVDAPDLDRFPEFASAPTWTATIEAGDLLFLPAFWLHAFRHEGEINANVNAWWRPARPAANVVSHRQALVDAVGALGVAPGTPEAAWLGRLEAALLSRVP